MRSNVALRLRLPRVPSGRLDRTSLTVIGEGGCEGKERIMRTIGANGVGLEVFIGEVVVVQAAIVAVITAIDRLR